MPQDSIFQLSTLVDLLLAVVLGFLIGLERKNRSKEAGIRTHAIVCVGSALIMIISKYAFGSESDAARVAAQIVAGVGFLGAGMIVYKKREITGLTTAAGIWATAGVGMACGGRLYIVAVGATLFLILVQYFFHLNVKLFRQKRSYLIKIEFYRTDDENLKIKEIFSITRFNHLVLKRDGDKVVYSAKLNTEKEFPSSALNRIIEENPFIISIERVDNE
ncbi:MAG: MgtC/SapB family protein [Clostridia bacterium]|nr:MgtC/SapB family protein [Clostridia bacterium]